MVLGLGALFMCGMYTGQMLSALKQGEKLQYSQYALQALQAAASLSPMTVDELRDRLSGEFPNILSSLLEKKSDSVDTSSQGRTKIGHEVSANDIPPIRDATVNSDRSVAEERSMKQMDVPAMSDISDSSPRGSSSLYYSTFHNRMYSPLAAGSVNGQLNGPDLSPKLTRNPSRQFSDTLLSDGTVHTPVQVNVLQRDKRPVTERVLTREEHLFDRLGLDDGGLGKLYFLYKNDPAAKVGYCFSNVLGNILSPLCAQLWSDASIRPCVGMDGYTCATRLSAKLTNQQSEMDFKKNECGQDFTPVCCEIENLVHAVQNYCSCLRAGGRFVAPGASCEEVEEK